jgi:hypothetical protein
MWTTLIIILFWLLAAHGAAQEQKYFYIYEWDDELADVYPPPGSKLDPKASYAHEFYANGGYGELVDGSSGMFATWQFSLFKNLMARLRVSDRRTMDPSKASAFIIPYDGGTHSFIDHKTGKIRLASPHGWQAIHRLKQASLTPNWKNGGHDHFSIFSVTGYQMVGIGTKVFYMQICQNCTVLSIETTPLKIAIAGRTHKYWYSIPYPSSYHWWEHMIDKPWAMNSTPRPTLTIFIGSVKTLNSASNSLRRKLFDECGMHPDDKV